LAHLFALSREEGLDIATIKGSYAGAMGWGQFMPSSYRIWGKDGDGDGRRDLLGDTNDIFASIANYFADHGWQAGQPVAARADRDPGARDLAPDSPKPQWTLSELAAMGYSVRPGEPVPGDAGPRATLVAFDGADGREYWIGYRNFYVITRYNHSPMYAMAVHQLAQAIRDGVGAPPGAAGASAPRAARDCWRRPARPRASRPAAARRRSRRRPERRSWSRTTAPPASAATRRAARRIRRRRKTCPSAATT